MKEPISILEVERQIGRTDWDNIRWHIAQGKWQITYLDGSIEYISIKNEL